MVSVFFYAHTLQRPPTPEGNMELISLNLPNPPEFRMDGGTSTLAAPSADFIESLIGLPAAAGKVVTRNTAIRVAGFLSCVKMLANDGAKMPLILRETKIVSGRQRTQPAIENSLYPILKDCPNDWQTSYQLRWFLWSQLIMASNCFCQKITDQKGDILALIPLNAWSMTQHWDRTNPKKPKLFWRYQDGYNTRIFQQSEIWHTASCNLDGMGIEGMAIIALAKEALSVLMAAEETAGRNFANGLGMSGFITFPVEAEVDPVQAQTAVDDLKKNNAGSQNAGKFTVIPMGGKFEKMSFNAQESQLLESRKWNEETIARLLGGAPLLVKMGLGAQNSTYASSSAFLDEYFNTCLAPYCTSLEQSITRDLIDPKDRGKLYAKHNADIFLRGSPKERAETNQILIQSFQMTPNEARAIEDRDFVEGGDFLTGGTGTPVVFDIPNNRFFIPGQLQPMLTDDESEQKKALTPPPPTLVQSQESDAEGGDQDEDGAELQVPPAKKGKKALPKPNKTKNRLEDIANSLVERVFRKEQKSGSVDAKFVAEVLNVSMEKAEEYVAKRPSQNEMEARATLFVLAMGE